MKQAVRYKYTAKGVVIRNTGEEITDPSIVHIADFLRPLKPAGSFKLRLDGRVTTKVLQGGAWVDVEFNIVDVADGNIHDHIGPTTKEEPSGEHHTD